MARYLHRADDTRRPPRRPAPAIDYERRRHLDYTSLLPDAEWEDIRLRIERADHLQLSRRLAPYARHVLFTRLSGLPFTRAPVARSRDGHTFKTRLAAFITALTPELAAELNGEAALVVRDRQPGVLPVTALHRHFRAGLDRYEPVTGLNDHPEVVAFHRLVFTTPSLAGRLAQYMMEDEEPLAGALGPGIQARLQAAQVLAIQRVLARASWQKIVGGRTARDIHPEAIADTDQAFAQLG